MSMRVRSDALVGNYYSVIHLDASGLICIDAVLIVAVSNLINASASVDPVR